MDSNKNLYRKTPLMGWASWNCFFVNINEEKIKAQADALVETGLADLGYTYLNVDDGYFGGRDENGKLCYHKERFPNGMRPIADYAHSKGLKAGIYSDAGDNTCGFYYNGEKVSGNGVGLYGHEEEDLKQLLVDDDFDFIKVDWCGGVRLGLSEEEQYGKIGRIIDRLRHETGKPLVFNICRWQFPGEWVVNVADSWRTAADIAPVYSSILHQLDNIKRLERFCMPGHVNDLDMMQIGNGLNSEEEKTHFAMWCMMSTPLMIGCDLTKISEDTLNVLKNKELIDINQDEACLQAYVGKEIYSVTDELIGEIWIKDLGSKDSKKKAVAFLNRSDEAIKIYVTKAELLLAGEILSVRDVCNHEDLQSADEWEIELPAHGTSVLVITAEDVMPRIKAEEEPLPSYTQTEKITMEECEELVKNGAVLIDVRAKDEYEKNHLDGAINVPYMDIHGIIHWYVTDKDKPLIVYCATGKRSSQAKTTLDYLGFKNVYYLGGVNF